MVVWNRVEQSHPSDGLVSYCRNQMMNLILNVSWFADGVGDFLPQYFNITSAKAMNRHSDGTGADSMSGRDGGVGQWLRGGKKWLQGFEEVGSF